MSEPRPIRVLHLIESIGTGGAEQLLLSTVKALDARRVESVVTCLFAPLDLRGAFEQAGVPVFPLSLRGRFDWRRGVFGLASLLREQRIDVVHTHLFHANVYGRVAAWLARTPVVTTLHSADYTYQDTGRVTFKLRKLIDRLTARHLTSAHLAVSKAVRDDYQRHLGLLNAEVLYNFVDLACYREDSAEARQAQRKACGCSEQDMVILNIGRLHPEKGQRFLVLAMPEILREIPTAKLIFVGTGVDEPELRVLAAARHLDHAIVFAGHQPDVRSFLAMADVFVLPSNIEGLPVSLLEAMAAGLPAIATKVGGSVEVVEDGVDGVLVPPANPEALAQAVVRLWHDSALRQRLAQHARATVEQRFSAGAQVPRLERLYQRLCEAPARSRHSGHPARAGWGRGRDVAPKASAAGAATLQPNGAPHANVKEAVQWSP